MEPSQTFAENLSFSYSDYDVNDFVFPSKYLQVFQDIAGDHADIIGCGYEAFKAKNLIWVIARARLDIMGNPDVGEPLVLSTKVKKPEGIVFEREMYLRGRDSGKIYATGISGWCVCNMTTRRLERPSAVPYPQSFAENYTYSNRLTALPLFDTTGMKPYEYRVGFVDLDHNRHMNNCKYADALENAVSPQPGQRFKSLEIDFEKEAVEGENLSIFVSPKCADGTFGVQAKKENGNLSFKASFAFAD